jgi:hypothetical protein
VVLWLVVLWLVVLWLVLPLGRQFAKQFPSWSCRWQECKSLVGSNLQGHLHQYVGNTSRWSSTMDVTESNCRENPYSIHSLRALAEIRDRNHGTR